MSNPQTVVFLLGPTAIGKSEVAVHLARKINAEIISCDSMQVYKGMDIVSSAPAKALLRQVAHHLLGVISPCKEYNVATYRREAMKKIRKIIKKGKVPLCVGGTGLYVSILIDGIFQAAPADEKIRSRLYRQAERLGSIYLYRKLKKVDPEAAEKIHPHDQRRIIRALEVFAATGKPISQLQKRRHGLGEEYELKIICLNMPRDKLYQRIDRRVEKMFRQGLVSEVKRLLRLKLSRTASQAIGIRELEGYFAGRYDLAVAKGLVKRHSRTFAKRQLTWFRRDQRINWLEVKAGEKPILTAERIWKRLS